MSERVHSARPLPGFAMPRCFRIIRLYLGSREFGYTVVEAVRDIPNIYLETSVQYQRDVLLKAAREIGSKRILFGVDWPYKPIETEVRKIQLLGFSQSELEDVYYRNIEQLWQKAEG